MSGIDALRVTDEPAKLAELQAELLARLAVGGDRDLLRRTVALLGREAEQGHVCVALAEHELRDAADGAIWPPLAEWRRSLLASGVVAADDGEPSSLRQPLVLDARHRLYTLRQFRAERQIAAFVRRRLAAPPVGTASRLASTLRTLELVPRQPVDWQLAAVVAMAQRSFAVLCGGPGTGKTTTVARLLQVLLHGEPGLRIAIAAPTGKAAARLGEALQQRAAEQRIELSLVPSTLHRLLGYTPFDDGFRHGRDRPLDFDLVVVDEASMVDPLLLAQLTSALPERARLLLVGDQDQLAAVTAGQVLGDLCRSARPDLGVGPKLAAAVEAATGMRLPVTENASRLADATVALRENHRFGAQPGIATFATAMAQRDARRALSALDGEHEDLRLVGDAEAALDECAPAFVAMLDAAAAGDAEAALAAMAKARVLTAQRHGPRGASWWNRRIEARLAALGRRTDVPFYVGRPLLVTANDHQSQIWNGDLGVVGRDARDQPVVWFKDGKGHVRALTPHRLPPHETAWAMTVHKAQGSEFDHVLLSLPEQPSPLWNAPLVYTGVTRARRSARVLADRSLLLPALGNWPVRVSGLVDALSAEPPAASR